MENSEIKKKIGTRIRQLRTELDITQEEFAKMIGVSGKSIIANYESGYSTPNDEIRDTICLVCNCSMDYLTCKTDIKAPIISHSTGVSPASAIVLIYGTIPAGVPMECIEDIIDTEEIPATWLKGDKKFFGLKIKGDSMYPEYRDGDTLILEKVDDCENGQDAVIMVNGNDGTFKRVIKTETGIILQPLNPKYHPMIYTNEQIENLPVKIIGVAKEIRRKI